MILAMVRTGPPDLGPVVRWRFLTLTRDYKLTEVFTALFRNVFESKISARYKGNFKSKHYTNPGLAQSTFEQFGPGVQLQLIVKRIPLSTRTNKTDQVISTAYA